MAAAVQLHRAAPPHDIFNRVEGKRCAVDFSVGRATRATAAHDGQGRAARRIEVEIKPSRLGNLWREEFRRGFRLRCPFHKKSIIVMRWPTIVIPLPACPVYFCREI